MRSRTTWYILTPTLAVSGLLLAVGMSGAWYVHRVNRDVSHSLHEVLAEAHLSARLVLEIRDLRVRLQRYVSDGDGSHLDDAETLLNALREKLAGDDPMRARLQSFRQRFDAFRQADPDRDAARQLASVLTDELLTPAEQLLDQRQDMATHTSSQNQELADRIGTGLLLLGVCGAVAGVLIGFGMARGVHRSLVEISVPVRDIAGQLNEVVGPIKVSSNTDLSELDGALRVLADKTADVVKRLQESQRETLRSEQLAAVGQLAAGLAHELRNPLMAVKLIIQTATEQPDASLSPRDLVVIEDEVTRLEKMLQTFLDFARPPQPEKHATDLRELVQHTVGLVSPRALQQNVQLWYTAPDDEVSIEADASQMRQVFLNLLFNALDALPGGGNIWLEISDSGAEWVLVRVADDGPGVPADVAPRIFEPFVSTKMTGIGLGLSISRRIVESHGGRIQLRNRADGGAEFTLRLPRQSARPAATLAAHQQQD